MRIVRILLADDHPILRFGLRMLLESQPGWKLVGEASTGLQAVILAEQLRPDIAILDITMPGLNGLDAAREILKNVPETRILVLSAYHSQEMAKKALQAGVHGYVLKLDAQVDLVGAVNALLQGQTFFTPAVSEIVVDQFRNGTATPIQAALTAREVEILRLLAAGKSNKEAAGILGISDRTVENHRAHIMEKLNMRSFSELVRYAIRNGLIEP